MFKMNKKDIPPHLIKFFRPVAKHKRLDVVDLPSMLADALRADGWYVRHHLCWRKLSPMPASLRGWRWEKCRVKVRSQGKPRQPYTTSQLTKGPSRDKGKNGGWIGGPEYAPCPGCEKCRANGGLVLRRGSWRPTSSWESVFLLSKSSKYFIDSEAALEPCESSTLGREKYTRKTKRGKTSATGGDEAAVKHDHESLSGGKRNPRDVFTVRGEPSREKHFAAFPSGFAAKFIAWSTSEHGCCAACGSPVCRVVERGVIIDHKMNASKWSIKRGGYHGRDESKWPPAVLDNRTIAWRPSCTCNANTASAVILDPFSGTGSTVLAAVLLGHRGIGMDLNQKYIDMSERRLRKRAGLFV